jgi:DNA polymerase-1
MLELVGISSYEKGKDFMFLFRKSRRSKTLIEKFIPFFENEKASSWSEFKIRFKNSSNYHVIVKGKLFDTMIAHYLINRYAS